VVVMVALTNISCTKMKRGQYSYPWYPNNNIFININILFHIITDNYMWVCIYIYLYTCSFNITDFIHTMIIKWPG
jgi:hypothetical protein